MSSQAAGCQAARDVEVQREEAEEQAFLGPHPSRRGSLRLTAWSRGALLLASLLVAAAAAAALAAAAERRRGGPECAEGSCRTGSHSLDATVQLKARHGSEDVQSDVAPRTALTVDGHPSGEAVAAHAHCVATCKMDCQELACDDGNSTGGQGGLCREGSCRGGACVPASCHQRRA